MTEILLLPTVKKVWNFLGYNFERTTWFMNFYTTLAFFLVLFVPILGIMVLILEDINLNSLADTLESCGPNYQLLGKIAINRFEIESIRYLLKQMEEKFWPINKFGPKVQEKQMKTYKIIKYSYKTYCYLMYGCGVIISARPLFLEERRYPLASYNIVDISNTYFYCFLYSFHVFDCTYGVFLFLAVDGLFAVFVINVLCQVIMLKHAFESLKINELKSKEEEDECYQRLKEYVDHHNLILEFIEKLNKLYSVQMFNQFLGNTVSICMGIYIISATGSDISTQIRSSLITVTFIWELAIYCIGGTLLSQACLEIAKSMYYSGWEGNNHKRFRTACYMIIMRSQKQQSLKAGGIFDISVITLTSVLQTSFSFFTLMNNVKNDM